MTAWKRARTLVVLLLAALVGYVAGPPLVHAVESLVVVKSGAAGKPGQARVTAHRLWVDAGPPPLPPSSADPTRTFSFMEFHDFTFENDPEGGLLALIETTLHSPCTAILPGASSIVVTGIDASSGPISIFPGGVGQFIFLDVKRTSGGAEWTRVFFQYHPTGFHDATGIRIPATQQLQIESEMWGAAKKTCGPDGCVLEPAQFAVAINVQGYCADET